MVAGNWVRAVHFLIALFGSLVSVTSAQENDRLIRLDDGIYARIASPNGNAVGNSGFIVLSDSVLVFDTHYTPEAGRQLLKEIRTITSKPVRYLVNSHFHPDHTHGNQVFAGAQVIGSRGTRRDILQNDLPSLNRTILVTSDQLERMRKEASNDKDPVRIESRQQQIKMQDDYLATLSQLKISAPFVVLEDYLAIRDGSSEVRIQLLGPGHTDSDTLLFLPSERIVFCGDLFFNGAIPNVQDAKILLWMETLGKILELDADRFIPGHGPSGNRQDVRKFLDYFSDLRILIEPFVVRGYSVEQTLQEIQIPKKYSRYKFQNFFQANIQKMYEELKTAYLMSIPIEGPQRPGK